MAKVEIGEIDFGAHRKYDLMKISRELFRLMMNNPKCDYASLGEMFGFEEMENYEPDEICRAVDELTGKEEYNNLLLRSCRHYVACAVYESEKSQKIPSGRRIRFCNLVYSK